MNTVSISTVTPVYAGKDFLLDLITRIEQVREKWRNSQSPLELTEAIFVNDASTDGSLEVLYEIQKEKTWVKVINLSRNFGQHQATVAGILHSSGNWIVTLDEDLQHDPSFIETMLEYAVNSELDIVYATPEESVHESLLRDWTSKTFKGLISYVTGNRHVREFNSYRLIRGAIGRASSSVCSHGTYFDVALCWFTNHVSSIKLPLKDVRFVESGKSGYTMRKLFSHARSMIVSSQTKVVRLGAAFGFIAMLVALTLGSKVLFDKLIDPASIPVQGWASLFLALLFFSGLLAVLLGVVLEYISVILLHIQGKPTFFVVDRQSDRILFNYYKDRKINDRVSKTNTAR
jgi:polyisoprenyl-phosphate glycosyltransferase